MATAPDAKILGMTHKQALLVGTLGLVLVGVLVFGQNGNETAPDTADDSARMASRRRSATVTMPVVSTNWPEVSLEQMLQNNPFADRISLLESANVSKTAQAATEQEPAGAAEATDEKTLAANERRDKAEAFLTELRTQRVKMILRSGEKVSAMIGERLIREGEIIDGVRIVSILPNAVLAEVTQRD